MKHRTGKVKFGSGNDENKMLLRKLASNFLVAGKMETTKSKAKVAQSAVERMVTKAKTKTEADKNYILKHVTTKKVADLLLNQIVAQLKDVKSGYTRVVRLGKRMTDGADLARLEWAYPVVLEAAKKPEVKKAPIAKAEKKEEPKTEEKKENKS